MGAAVMWSWKKMVRFHLYALRETARTSRVAYAGSGGREDRGVNMLEALCYIP